MNNQQKESIKRSARKWGSQRELCECGVVYQRWNRVNHIKTKSHKRFVEAEAKVDYKSSVKDEVTFLKMWQILNHMNDEYFEKMKDKASDFIDQMKKEMVEYRNKYIDYTIERGGTTYNRLLSDSVYRCSKFLKTKMKEKLNEHFDTFIADKKKVDHDYLDYECRNRASKIRAQALLKEKRREEELSVMVRIQEWLQRENHSRIKEFNKICSGIVGKARYGR